MSATAALTGVGLAGVSNAVAACFTNPVDVIKVRMQLAGVSQLTSCNATVLSAVRQLWESEGLRGLHRGLQPSMLRELSYSGLRMGLYEPVREHLVKLQGAVGALLANPFDLLKVRMQGSDALSRVSVTAALRSIYQQAGLVGLWRGAGPTVQRAALLTASQVPSYDHAKHKLLDAGLLKEGYFCHFSCSMLAGVVAAGVTSPVDLAKSRIMTQPENGALYTSTLDCLVKTAKAEGLPALYRGFSMQWLRLGPHTTISLMCFEQLRHLAGMSFL
ncbi:unnamed protein product [Effrenium voratum]|uniref:Uncharacterized protein n=1 Tax=Effrenium voratum TaxID=2562239 RepID=A0AA36I8L8_9DINO|nr:unnamed protein product [Effrenium voratum]CAJ1383121.1 unnamed protein product [Effrenium voratum]